jgi:hypothetical protein
MRLAIAGGKFHATLNTSRSMGGGAFFHELRFAIIILAVFSATASDWMFLSGMPNFELIIRDALFQQSFLQSTAH